MYIDENVKVSLEEMIVEDLLEFDVKWVDCIGFLKFFCFFEDFKYGIFNLVFIKL